MTWVDDEPAKGSVKGVKHHTALPIGEIAAEVGRAHEETSTLTAAKVKEEIAKLEKGENADRVEIEDFIGIQVPVIEYPRPRGYTDRYMRVAK